MSRRRFISGSALVAASNGTMALATFARSVIFARVLGPENMGIAALAIAVYGLLGLITDIGFEKLLVQSPKGESRVLQGAAHLLAAVRGAVCAALVFVAAGPVVSMFGEPEAADALGILAGVFLIRGLAHTDKWRYQRDMRFGASAVIDVSGVMVSLALAPVLAVWLGDYRAVVLALLAQGATEMIASHIVADRGYRWSRDRESLSELWAFGLPLLLAGVLMFASMQGDRFIVASLFTTEQLGVYAVAFGLAQMPVIAFGRVTTTLFLPTLSRVREDVAVFRRRLIACGELQALFCLAFCCPMFLAGTEIMTLVFGEAYSTGGAALAWLSLGFALRLARSVTALAAVACGDTKNSLIANAFRAAGLALVLGFALADRSLLGVALGIVCAELLALLVSSHRLHARQNIDMLVSLRPPLVTFAIGLGITLVGRWIASEEIWNAYVTIGFAAVAGLVACSIGLACAPVLRNDLMNEGMNMFRKRHRATPPAT